MDRFLAMKVSDIQPARVVGKGGPLRSYRPLDKFPDLFKIFVKIPRTPEGVLEFINKFGPLTLCRGRRFGTRRPRRRRHDAEAVTWPKPAARWPREIFP